MTRYTLYRKTGKVEARPWIEGDDMSEISVSPKDAQNGSPKTGDWIARDPNDPEDMWLISEEFFHANYEEDDA